MKILEDGTHGQPTRTVTDDTELTLCIAPLGTALRRVQGDAPDELVEALRLVPNVINNE